MSLDTVAGPYPVEFNTSVASERFAFKKGDHISLNRFSRDARTANGICHAVDSLDNLDRASLH
jgi:hypothetical protein